MTFRDRDIWQCQTIRSGIKVENAIYDWADAALSWGYKWEEFLELDGEEQAFLVAVNRTRRQVDAVIAAEQVKKMKAANKAKK